MAPSVQAPLITALTTPVFVVTGPGVLPALLVPLPLGGRAAASRPTPWVRRWAAPGRLAHPRPDRRSAGRDHVLPRPYLPDPRRGHHRADAARRSPGPGTSTSRGWIDRGRCLRRPGGAVEDADAGLPPGAGRSWGSSRWPRAGAGPATRQPAARALPPPAVAAALVPAATERRSWDYLTSSGYGRARSAYGPTSRSSSLDSWRESSRYVQLVDRRPPLACCSGSWPRSCSSSVLVEQVARRARPHPGDLRPVAPACPSRSGRMLGAGRPDQHRQQGHRVHHPAGARVGGADGLGRSSAARASRRRVALARRSWSVVANTAAAFDPRSSADSEPRAVHLPWLGDSVVTNGAGSIQHYIRGGQVGPGTAAAHLAQGRAWSQQHPSHRLTTC